MKSVVLKTVGTIFLMLAVFHGAGYVFGWTKFRQEDWFPLIIGGISGGFGVFVMARREAKRKLAAK